MPNFFIGTDGRVSVGMKPNKILPSGNRGQLEVDGMIYSKGQPVMTSHIGQIIMTTTLDTAAKVSAIYGGTWAAWGAGRVPVGVNTSDSDFSTVQKTGGSKTHSHEYGIWYAGWYGMVSGLNGDYIKLLNGGTDTWGYKSQTSPAKQGTLSANPSTGASNAPACYQIKADTTSSSDLQPYITVYMWRRTA